MNKDQINHQLIAQKARQVQGMRRAVAQAQELHDQRQPAQPTQYSIFERIVALASEHAEAMTAACVIIEREFFVGDSETGYEWTGGELSTMQAYEAALEFGVRAMAAGWTFDTERSAWADQTGKVWNGAAVKRRIIGIAGEAKGEEVTE